MSEFERQPSISIAHEIPARLEDLLLEDRDVVSHWMYSDLSPMEIGIRVVDADDVLGPFSYERRLASMGLREGSTGHISSYPGRDEIRVRFVDRGKNPTVFWVSRILISAFIDETYSIVPESEEDDLQRQIINASLKKLSDGNLDI
jgi:hypothetical protein